MFQIGLFSPYFSLLGFSQCFLYVLSLAHFRIDILKAADQSRSAARHIHFSELDAEVSFASIIHGAEIVNVKLRTFLKDLSYPLEIQDIAHHLTIALRDTGHYVFFFCLRKLRVTESIMNRSGMHGIAVCIPAVKRKAFCLYIIDDPHCMVRFAECFYDSLTDGHVGLQPLPLFCYVRDKDIINTAVRVGLGVMAVIFHPPDSAVLPYYAVFYIIDIIIF